MNGALFSLLVGAVATFLYDGINLLPTYLLSNTVSYWRADWYQLAPGLTAYNEKAKITVP